RGGRWRRGLRYGGGRLRLRRRLAEGALGPGDDLGERLQSDRRMHGIVTEPGDRPRRGGGELGRFWGLLHPPHARERAEEQQQHGARGPDRPALAAVSLVHTVEALEELEGLGVLGIQREQAVDQSEPAEVVSGLEARSAVLDEP